jgi:di/tricarboxylate transporter
LSIHAIGVIGLVLIFVIGALRPINLGALSLVMTFLVGSIFARESVKDMYGGFPVDILVLLAGLTYLFAIASNNGTVERVVAGASKLIKGQRALVPWVVFVAAALPTMGGAPAPAGVALLAPLALRLAHRYDLDRRMIGLMVVHGAASGNFSPLNVLGAIVTQTVARNGLEMSSTALFLGNLAYNAALGVTIYLVFGGLSLIMRSGREAMFWRSALAGAVEAARPSDYHEVESTERLSAIAGDGVERGETDQGRLAANQVCTVLAILSVAVAALVFGINIGFLAFGAAALLHMIFPSSSGEADKRIAWRVVLLACGVLTYVSALQRYGTVEAIGNGVAALGSPLLIGLLICGVGAVTSAFAASPGILGAMIPLAVPFMARGDVGTTGMVVALAISATVVDATPFSAVGALVVANADDQERPRIYRGLLLWGGAMVLTAPLMTWLIFILPAA